MNADEAALERIDCALDPSRERSEPLMPRSFLTTFLICSAAILALTLGSLFGNQPVPVRYVDVTAASRLQFLHRNSATPSKFLIETMTGGVALFDYDNDGWLDVYFVNGAKLKENQTDTEPLEKTGPEYWNRLFATIMTEPLQT
jgi:hypothetical protein